MNEVIGVIKGFNYRGYIGDNGKEHGNYYLGLLINPVLLRALILGSRL